MTIVRARHSTPALWAMILAVWALLVLGGAPSPGSDAVCAAGSGQPAGHDCLASAVCCAVQPAAMVIADAAMPPRPRGGQLGAEVVRVAPVADHAPCTTGWARAPPEFA